MFVVTRKVGVSCLVVNHYVILKQIKTKPGILRLIATRVVCRFVTLEFVLFVFFFLIRRLKLRRKELDHQPKHVTSESAKPYRLPG